MLDDTIAKISAKVERITANIETKFDSVIELIRVYMGVVVTIFAGIARVLALWMKSLLRLFVEFLFVIFVIICTRTELI